MQLFMSAKNNLDCVASQPCRLTCFPFDLGLHAYGVEWRILTCGSSRLSPSEAGTEVTDRQATKVSFQNLLQVTKVQEQVVSFNATQLCRAM